MTWKPNVTVAAVIEAQGRYLLVQERDHGALVFNQPAGHLEPGESLLQAVVRETLEETGRRFEPEALVGIYRYHSPEQHITYLRVCFCGPASEPDPAAERDPDIADSVWLAPETLQERSAELRSPMVQRCIEDHRAGRRFPLDLLVELDEP